jgi:nitrous oxide reductase accessory protein NosL
MKNIILSVLVMAFALVSCNQKSKQAKTSNTQASTTATQLYACSMHPEVTGKQGDKCSKCGMELTEPVSEISKIVDTVAVVTTPVVEDSQTTFSVKEIVINYLTLKNALAKDDSKGAAGAGKALYTTFNSVNTKLIDAKLKATYLDIADDAKEHAEHIGDNSGKIEHQREHFVMLSKDINDLIKTFGTKQKLYQDYCPMADEGKGAIWISETKEIKNPYYGSQMLTCGSVKKEL